MKFDIRDAIAAAAVAASAIGFYVVGRYHEDYLNEKRNAPEEQPAAAEPQEANAE